MKEPLVSVVVLTRDRAESLRQTLLTLTGLDYANHEVIVVDNRSMDHTAQVAAEFGVRYLFCPAPGVSMCRQRGIEAARGEIVAMCDDDCRPVREWLSCLVQRLCTQENLALVGGHIINIGFGADKQYKGRGKIGRNGVSTLVADPREADYYGSANIAFKKAALQAVGGYDPFFRTGGYEEAELMTRLRHSGFRTGYEPAAVSEHHHTTADHRHDRVFYSGPAPRLYFYLKHHRPRTLDGWLSFLGYELWLLGQDLAKLARPIAGAILKLRFDQWLRLGVRLFNVISPRIAIPWLLWKARVQCLNEKRGRLAC
jgi:glycosyltransferase involved in cell wall biosynthesis